MKKLLIATNSQAFADSLAESLSEQFEISVCDDGTEAVQLLRDIRPELLVLDMMLPGIDGVGVLKMAHTFGVYPKVIAYSPYISDYLITASEQLNVCSLIRIPCGINHLAARILEIAFWQEQEPNLDTELRSILAMLGFKINHAGCVVTEACIKCYLQDPCQVLYSQLYPAVERILGKTASSVERAMGRAIEAAWNSRDERIWRMYFSVGRNGKVAKPSNAQFMARIAECLKPWAETEADIMIG